MRNQPWHQGPDPAAIIGTGKSPLDLERFRIVAWASRLLLVASALALPLSVWLLTADMVLPLVFSGFGLAIAAMMHRLAAKGRQSDALHVLFFAMLAIGGLVALLSTEIANFGLAIALLAPTLAALFNDRRAGAIGWGAVSALIALSLVSAGPLTAFMPAVAAHVGWTAAAVYGVFSMVVALAASRLSRIASDTEKAKIDAFHHLIEQLQGAVVRLSPEGETLFVSHSAETLFGCRRYELTRAGLVERMHVHDRPAFLKALSDAQTGGRPATLELRMRRDDAGAPGAVPNFVWVEVSVSPVAGRNNQTERHECILMLRDIAARKHQEEQMLAARKQAQEASIAKSRFLATIGHELRTPLNAIVGFSDMMRSDLAGPLDEDQREYADLIHSSGMHLLDIVTMLLDMSKIEAGRFELQLEQFCPAGLVEACVRIVAPLAAKRGVTVTVLTEAAPVRIVGDERAYRQVLINLLSNAIKFSHAGGTVTLSVRRQGGRVVFTVADRGIGMAPEIVQRLGEPFYQAHSGTARQYEGTGLGLSIVKGLIDLHQGHLDIASRPGSGTTVSVLMPIKGPRPAPGRERVVASIAPKDASNAPSAAAGPIAETPRKNAV